MMTKLMAVAVGGAIGTVLRFYIQTWSFGRYGASFPYGTLFINLSGAFVIGIAMMIFLKHVHIMPQWRLFFVTGILGGYTTFSALAWETYELFAKGHTANSVLYVTSSFIGGLLCVSLGAWLGNFF